jgi:predicted nucleotidyltransferase
MESINFGRGVGYEVNKYTPTEEIANISATFIRESIKAGNENWRKFVPVELQEDIISNIR